MTIKEKLEMLSGSAPNELFLFKEGVFWIAYEQYAYWFHLQKGYKPTKKFVKIVGQEVVNVGFPESALKGIAETSEIDGTMGTNVRVFALKEEIDLKKFEEWKAGLSLTTVTVEKNKVSGMLDGTSGIDETIVERVREFDIANATPMECMMFVAELKKGCSV